jgi:hypothetical protein
LRLCHYWQCDGAALRANTEPSLSICFDHGVPMEEDDHSRCTVELLACPEHRESPPRQTELVPSADNVCHCEGNVAAMKGGIEIPPRRTLLRALGRASRYDFVGACVWCGHGYRQFSLEIQEVHLKGCAEYQRGKAVLAQSGLS